MHITTFLLGLTLTLTGLNQLGLVAINTTLLGVLYLMTGILYMIESVYGLPALNTKRRV